MDGDWLLKLYTILDHFRAAVVNTIAAFHRYEITAYLHETTRGRSCPFVQVMQCTAPSARIAGIYHYCRSKLRRLATSAPV